MIRKYVLPLLALGGLIFAVSAVIKGHRTVPPAEPATQPSVAPFQDFVAGSGLVEASTENIGIGTPLPGVVTAVYVQPGMEVQAGDPLFKLDDRPNQAELKIRQAALEMARQKLTRLQNQPRPEDVPPVEAKVKEAEVQVADLQDQLAHWERVGKDERVIVKYELDRKRFALQAAQARLKQAQSELAQLKAGTWKPDLQIAQAEVQNAEAQVKSTETDLERLTVRAPISGHVLQVKVRLGEYAQAGVLQIPLVMLGNVNQLHVRVNVDENDAWRIRAGAPAYAFVRGNSNLKTRLEFVRFEPYVVPKRSLTGDSSERVDTRVLEVIYRFDRQSLPVYVGQQMDVFIQAEPVAESQPTTTTMLGVPKD